MARAPSSPLPNAASVLAAGRLGAVLRGQPLSRPPLWRRHMEIGGVDLPLGKGVSFYKVNEQGEVPSMLPNHAVPRPCGRTSPPSKILLS